ncbi:MAG: DUF3313 family protein [Pseudomonadota bacterium]
MITLKLVPTRTLAAVLLCGSLSAACASQQTTQTGYLGGAPLTPVGAKGSRALTYSADDRGRAAYKAVLVERPSFHPGHRTPREPKSADVAALTAAYAEALERHFGRRYALVEQPGPGVLRVRAAITGYDLADVTANVLLTPLVGPMSNGGAASEAEVLDSLTGERMAALATHTNGSMWGGGPLKFFRARAHAERALDGHARRLAAQVAAVDGLSSKR